jgi:hypothetical protein
MKKDHNHAAGESNNTSWQQAIKGKDEHPSTCHDSDHRADSGLHRDNARHFFLSGKDKPSKDVDVNITVPQATPYSANTPSIRQAPRQSPPPIIKQPKYNMPAPPATPTPVNNTNEQVIPKRTPQLQPSKSPP